MRETGARQVEKEVKRIKIRCAYVTIPMMNVSVMYSKYTLILKGEKFKRR